jgi:acyl-CoA synthetase (AMP-forming)/AMP-acid ligase II
MGGEDTMIGELLERGARLANALRGAGLAPGTPVAAMLEDRISSLEVYVGTAFGGYPVVHVNDRLAALEVAHILADSGAPCSTPTGAARSWPRRPGQRSFGGWSTSERTGPRARSGSMTLSATAVRNWR